MCSQTRNSCAKAFDNRLRSKNLKPKKSRGGGQFDPSPPWRLLGLKCNTVIREGECWLLLLSLLLGQRRCSERWLSWNPRTTTTWFLSQFDRGQFIEYRTFIVLMKFKSKHRFLRILQRHLLCLVVRQSRRKICQPVISSSELRQCE